MDGALINCLLQPRQLYLDTKRSSIYRDFAKTHANIDVEGNSIKLPAAMCKVFSDCILDRHRKATKDIIFERVP
jgi:hypothetical protein